ncbi:MAG: serine/threonine-protein kinase [Myxococcota bacterium]
MYIRKRASELQGLGAYPPIGRLGRYQLLGRLAAGGMAEIYLAREPGPKSVHRHVVVKRILPHVAEDEIAVAMFVHEAKLCVQLQHPNICPVYEFGEDNGTYFLAMEWVRGVSLRALIQSASRGNDASLSVHVITQVFIELAGALHHAHTATDSEGVPLGIVHRDVTPENIIVGYNGVPKLIDFGVAKAKNQQHRTEKGVLKGKFAYMSPEQYQGASLDPRSDVFSLCICLHEALTGNALFERASEYETVAAIVLDPEIPSVRQTRQEVSQCLEDTLMAGLAKDRSARIGSADQLQKRLVATLENSGRIIRHAAVSEYLELRFPGQSKNLPTLDRRPVAFSRKHDEADSIQRMMAGVEIDDAENMLMRSQKRKPLRLILLLLLMLAGLACALSWVIHRARVPAQETVSELGPCSMRPSGILES